MHKNELVNVLYAALADVQRHIERIERLRQPAQLARQGLDAADAREVERTLRNIARELEEAVLSRSLGR